jgi:acetoin utilization deacetylase AcuC-like enzyme
MTVAYITHPNCLDHRMGPHHPEGPERLRAIQDRLVSSGLEFLLSHFDAPLVHYDQLVRAHNPAYIRRLEAAAPDHDNDRLHWLDGDTALSHHTLPAAFRSAGAAVLATDLVMGEKVRAAFACTRPPGHHATRNQAMGFCFFNNLAIAAYHALDHHGLDRVAIVDFDVHHGNGTEDIVAGDQRILFCSSFEHPFYPYSGADSTAPNVINLPLPAGTDGSAFRRAVEDRWLPRLDEFAPGMILISAGFDGHLEDQMAHFRLREPDYAWITAQLVKLADRHAAGRIVSCLEGGYELSSLGRSVNVHLDELIGHP